MSTHRRPTGRQSLITAGLLGLIRLYQRIFARTTLRHCRFYPSCSEYAYVALQTHGFIRGLGLIVWRLGRCHPLHPGGIDPVPPSHKTPKHLRNPAHFGEEP